MPTFVLAHRAAASCTPSADTVAAWKACFERPGSNLVYGGNPVFA